MINSVGGLPNTFGNNKCLPNTFAMIPDTALIIAIFLTAAHIAAITTKCHLAGTCKKIQICL